MIISQSLKYISLPLLQLPSHTTTAFTETYEESYLRLTSYVFTSAQNES